MICSNEKCTGYATENSELCFECEIRYNTQTPEVDRLLTVEYNKNHPDWIRTGILKKELLRRGQRQTHCEFCGEPRHEY